MVIVGFYTVIQYLKNSPTIYVDDQNIKFNDESRYWSEIEQISLTGKQPFKYIFNHDMEGISFKFKDGSIKYAYDSMYSNLWEVKSYIRQVTLDKKIYMPVIIEKSNSVSHETFDFFKGSPIFSFRGVILWGFIAFFFVMAFKDGEIKGLPIVVFINSLWFLLNSYFMYYFGISENYFIVKNHNFLWVNKIILLTDIEEIVFETRGKMPNCLRLITKDYKTKLYPAGTLTEGKWRELREKLNEKNIIVRNEIMI